MNRINIYSTTLAERRYETLKDLIDTINDADGHEIVNLLIHDGFMSYLYSPREIELFNDEFLSSEITNLSVSCIDNDRFVTLHVTI